MQIQVHSDHNIAGSSRLVDWVSASVASRLERFDEELTRIVVHLHDDNGSKAGAHDKRCQIEARPKGLQPVSVTHKAESLEHAIDGSIEKLHSALDHQFGKMRSKRVASQQAAKAAGVADLVLEEE
ncbi:HPF/RaiA family ribosome-associated protein [Ectopseudomonas mendocina]|uniref:HPF/RaiA family ribosome-associated protein n=1 Tax=Ectopseudomonas mendocina TaxID=300 RepID=A0ABZ2RE55_ECTME